MNHGGVLSGFTCIVVNAALIILYERQSVLGIDPL